MPVSEEPDLPRQCRLHEAGHAIVAVDLGLTVRSVFCDGAEGACESELSVDSQNESRHWREIHRKFPCLDTVEQIVGTDFGWLASVLGGIAGESLILGRPAQTLRRASDDLGNFYGFLSQLTRDLDVAQANALWLKTFIRAQEKAWDIVPARKRDVEKIADRLAKQTTLSGDEIHQLIS